MPDHTTCRSQSFAVDLPRGADFFHRGRPVHLIPEYGPELLQIALVNRCDRISDDWVIVGDVASRRYLLFGAVTARRSLTTFIVHRENSLITRVTAFQPEIARDDEPEEIVRLEGDDWRDLLVRYAELVMERAGAVAPDTAVNATGYCSWYYNYEKTGEAEFLEAVRALGAHRGVFPARHAQIDDGYQAAHGDWLERNASWPSPLADTVREIKAAGFEAGIWTMPLMAATTSRLFAGHPDWFVRDRRGEPKILHGWSPAPDHLWATLDFSRPEVGEHIGRVFRTFREWGFTYYKLDGWFTGTNGVRSRPGATGTADIGTCLRIIREAVGKESVVLGCGTPFLPSVGLVDHTRVSCDTGKTWRSWFAPPGPGARADESQPCEPGMACLENALHGSLNLWWQHDRWFRADPDCIMARDENTALTAGEARMSALSGIVTGVVITSDRLDRMGHDRRELLGRAARLRLRGARPLDWQDNAWPKVFRGEVDGLPATAVFNYSESAWEWTPAELGLRGPLQELLHPLGALDGNLKLGPHDAALVIGKP